jgi:DNA-binding FadR family transcriptional regulator
VIRQAVDQITDQTLEEAKTFAEEFARETDSSRWSALNRQFHYTLYKDCKRPYHLQIIANALDNVSRYLRAQLVLTSGIERARREHAGILNAAINRDSAEAAAAHSCPHFGRQSVVNRVFGSGARPALASIALALSFPSHVTYKLTRALETVR